MQLKPFSIWDCTSWEVVLDEPGGAEEKEWLRDSQDRKWLFKPVTIKNGHRHGEDWAEKIAGHLGCALTIPCARIELARRERKSGTVSLNLRPEGFQLQGGRVLLQALQIPGYIPGNVKGRPGHSLTNIKVALEGMGSPPSCSLPEEFDAFDVFAGYILFDAWIANRDRHDENWAVLIPESGSDPARLCGSYDQANSLGYNLRTERCLSILSEPGEAGVRRWAERGTAWRLEHDPLGGPMTLVKAADQALRLASDHARTYWLDHLNSLKPDIWDAILARVPELSDPARRFASRLLDINRERLLNECA